jgi:curli biogenesis system outer membrane secretion channel CsgG
MWRNVSGFRATAALVLSIAAFMGCSSSKESASRDTLTENVGRYSAPPSGIAHPRVGIPPFNVTTGSGVTNRGDLNDLAADQCSTLMDQTGRFAVIERTQLQKLLNEQGLEGIVRGSELAKQGNVRGVDYLLLGKVTNLRIKREKKGNNFGLATVTGAFNMGGADVKNTETVITTECGVDLRLVDPSTGEFLTSNFSEFKRTDSAKSMGLSILGANAESTADVDLSEDDKGKILRLALDDTIRKMLPTIDRKLRDLPPKATSDATAAPVNNPPVNNPPPVNQPANPPVASSDNTAQPPAAKKFCPQCGHEVAAGIKFCPNCGAKVE